MKVVAEAQPNIALVKYWGKRDVGRNLPAVGSLSLTLDALTTRMAVEFADSAREDRLTVGGREAPTLLGRVSACLDRVCGSARPRAQVESTTNFPIGAGLASSASAFAALVTAASGAAGLARPRLALARLAGEASGSAARSFYDGVVELSPGTPPADEIDVASIAGAADWPLTVLVAVTDPREKALPSGEAMRASAATSPFYRSWIERQPDDLAHARRAVHERDFAALAEVAEHNCLKMHSLTWTSRPAVVYWNAATVAAMETVLRMRRDGVPVFFTMDAGPQVKAICLPGVEDEVRSALADTPGVLEVLASGLGCGARLVEDA